MRLQPRERPKRASVLSEFREGFGYVAHFKPARALMSLIAIFSLSGVPAMMVLMPVFGAHFAGPGQGGARIYGFLTAASGLGALAGAVHLASRKTVLGLGRMIAICSTLYALAIAGFALSPFLWLSLLIAPLAGWGMFTNFAATNTILQTVVDGDKRGRVMAFYAMAFLGMLPFGALVAGKLAAVLAMGHEPVVGASRTILLMSGICLMASIRYWLVLPEIRELIRPIYIQQGILPQIAEGLQVADAPAPTET
jgi:MFS family permease